MSEHEKRTVTRTPLEYFVEVKATESDHRFYGASKDLSVNAICIKANYPARPGESLEISVVPPNGSAILPVEMLVKVIRTTPVKADSYEVVGKVAHAEGLADCLKTAPPRMPIAKQWPDRVLV